MPTSCTIDGCSNPVFAKGLCVAHYMRQRRTGKTTASAPGRKPSNKPPEIVALRQEVEALRRQLAQPPTASESKVDELRKERNKLARECGVLKRAVEEMRLAVNERAQENHDLREENQELKQRIKAAVSDDPVVRVNGEVMALRQQLQSQLKGFERLFHEQQTRIGNLRENRGALIINKRDRNTLYKAVHPDSLRLPDSEREKLMTMAMQILNRLNLQVDDDH